MSSDENLREKLAELSHEIWSRWMEYLFSKCENVPAKDIYMTSDNWPVFIIPDSLVKRWNEQIYTKYKDLTEKEKDTDREQADKILKVLRREVCGIE